jgi:hypothetical protein
MFRNLRHERPAGDLLDLRATRERDLERALSAEHRRVLETLARADRQPVSIRELEQAGIRKPGTLIYELEVAGESIEHVYAPGPNGHRRLAGFRLVRESDGARAVKRPGRTALLGALRGRVRD